MEFSTLAIWLFWSMIFFTVIWSLTWKGLALWQAARRDQKVWYVVLLVVNTLGVLEIIYLLFFSRQNKRLSEKEMPQIKPNLANNNQTPSNQIESKVDQNNSNFN